MRAAGQDKFHGQVDGPCTVLYVEPGEKVEVECGYGQRAVVVFMPVEPDHAPEPAPEETPQVQRLGRFEHDGGFAGRVCHWDGRAWRIEGGEHNATCNLSHPAAHRSAP